MLISNLERQLCRELRDLPKFFNNRYGKDARQALQRLLFRGLVNGNDDFLTVLFRNNIPGHQEEWLLRDAQGAVDGSEYTEAARGKPCGHIFKSGEATYRCRTCTSDDTCVLCSRCFEASDHTGHMVYISISPGNSGCCDCGDAEAWRLPVNCAIHTAGKQYKGKAKEAPLLPDELVESIRMTIGRAFDYMCDVISCSPEQLRLAKSEDTIKNDERASRLASKWYEEGDDIEANPEFALILWNDEKHTVVEVQTQVARACNRELAFGLNKARETDDVGRSVVTYSRDPKQLLRIANIIENIKITVTIRSARDTFREQMCSTIIEWLLDISGCTVGQDNDILKQTVCKEMLKLWKTGSEATNAAVGKDGIDDHQIDEVEEERDSVAQRLVRAIAIAGPNANRAVNRPFLTTMEGFGTLMDAPEENENEEGDDEDESQMLDGDSEDQMELDLDLLASDPDGDLDMPTAGEPEDTLEVSEATYAGYPPPPPPPPQQHSTVFHASYRATSGSDSGDTLVSPNATPKPIIAIPKTPIAHARQSYPSRSPEYWLQRPRSDLSDPPLSEDIQQRVRLDWMILFDLRLWKKARVDLRDLYISTVVTVPEFKRILGLRFAGLYTVLAQLYLIADREPDHSIIYLSLQMLTTPSITEEIVEKGNFLTHLIAILYTFLTTRQVGHPWEVSSTATLAFDAGSVTNRRMYHFFMDLKHLFASDYVQEKLRQDTYYVLQFLDLIKLPQGICPNVRAVGDHIEYETDAWISASLLTREINKLCRQFAEAFRWRRGQDTTSISKIIREIAKATIINSVGAERMRFDQAEIKSAMHFKTMTGFPYDRSDAAGFEPQNQNVVVDFIVEKETISFHHALHYTLSWLIDGAKSMTRIQLRSLLQFQADELKYSSQYSAMIPGESAETYLIAMFDYPLRVCAWLAQMKAGMWVRNGLSLRHQMSTYRGVSQRDLAHHRDIFLLQTAMVTCNPSRVLLSMIDRFGMSDWMTGKYINRRGYEDTQLLDVAEDFIHLLIVLLSDRISLIPLEDEPQPQVLAIRRDIAHILCFKPLSFSDLCGRLAEKFQDLEEFQDILEEMTTYKAPEGLSDTGTFELKQEYLSEIDPYIAHYTKNQRDEAETLYRAWMANRVGKPAADIVFEPNLRPIRSGVFEDISTFSRTPLFSQIIYYALTYASTANDHSPEIPLTRIEAYLQVVLHLVLSAILEDVTDEEDSAPSNVYSFVDNIIRKNPREGTSIFVVLQELSSMDGFKASHARIRVIFLRLQQKRPLACSRNALAQGLPMERLGSDSPLRLPVEDAEEKKQQALARQVRVMAQFQQQQQDFLNTQSSIDWGEDEIDDVESVATGYTDEHKQVWKYPSGNCILCQEETNDTKLFGTFALLSQSNVLRQTDLEDSDFIAEVISTPSSLDRSAEEIRPFGVGGQNRTQIRKLATDGHEVITERQGLGKGFPPLRCLQGPVSTGCGHIMHYKCFELYYSATQRRQNHQIARNHPERLEYKEFVCPLCKALGNTFLPIIWKGKEEIYPGVLQLDLSFEDWLNSSIGLTVSRFHKHPMSEDNKSVNSRHQELFVSHSLKDMITPLASRLPHLMIPDQMSPTSPQYSIRTRMPGMFPDGDDGVTSPTQSTMSETHRMDQLMIIYNRIRDTILKNKLTTRFNYPPKLLAHAEELAYTDALARAVGFSISATEIAQRGVDSQPGSLLLDRISPLVLTHLRILSETSSSYIAIASLRNAGNNRANQEFLDSHSRQLLQLFAGHPRIYGDDDTPWAKTPAPVPPALTQDSFILLVECAIYLVPALHLEIHHIIRICYLLELVKVALAIYCKPGIPDSWPSTAMPAGKPSPSKETLQAFSGFMHRIRDFGDPTGTANDLGETAPEILIQLCSAVSTYALPFLRKVVILLHVRYGVEFPSTGFTDIDEPEIDRLTKALRMPTLTDMFASIGKPQRRGDLTVLEFMVAGWINHWSWARKVDSLKRPISAVSASIRPSHPAIFELIGLPKYYDTLLDEMMRRRCPSTGKDMVDPALCLFCGDIFCSQAVCCSKDGLGGCNQHLKKCGHDVGLYLNIRKCMVLYLHARNGSWTHAPYLDKHGEVDPGLRRSRQLFLNQKRYDALLRNVWLQHGIPTTISRKLEADINNGGWETL
ncbi:hypothetical protein MMC27_000047 [Xylographa pallens]|nr:hypothetical protein [Xylographa pallens]